MRGTARPCTGAFDWLIPRPNDWYCMRELIPLG